MLEKTLRPLHVRKLAVAQSKKASGNMMMPSRNKRGKKTLSRDLFPKLIILRKNKM